MGDKLLHCHRYLMHEEGNIPVDGEHFNCGGGPSRKEQLI
jgi:hypothetical protein